MSTLRRRDRHGRGLRGPLVPRGSRTATSPSGRFDEMVLRTVERLERRWSAELEAVEFAVEDVPPSDPAPWEEQAVPLGRFFTAEGRLSPRIVVYRRPIETRATGPAELESLTSAVVVEQVAQLLGVEPERVDPRYEGG